jgi:hypothetical protein
MLYQPNKLFDDEKADIREELKTLVAEPDRWLDSPNDQLGGRKPKEFIGAPDEQRLRDLLRAIKYGIPT